MSVLQPTRRLAPGEGVVKLARAGQQAVFETVQFSYPLKLIVPKRHFMDGLNVLYMISYGGGLVAGDRVVMHVEVEKGATLVLLTQGTLQLLQLETGYSTPLISYRSAVQAPPKSSKPAQDDSSRLPPSPTALHLPPPTNYYTPKSILPQL